MNIESKQGAAAAKTQNAQLKKQLQSNVYMLAYA